MWYKNIKKLQCFPMILLPCWFYLQPKIPKTAVAKWHLPNFDSLQKQNNPLWPIFLSTGITQGQPQQHIVLTSETIEEIFFIGRFNLSTCSCNEGNPISLSVLLSIRLRTFEGYFMIQSEVEPSPSQVLFEMTQTFDFVNSSMTNNLQA